MSKELHATKCRACMFPLNTATNIVPIFKEYKSSTMLAHMIAETIHILPEPNDNLGGNVCKLCAEKIYAFYEFRLSYLESEKKLREMLLKYETNQRLTASYSDSVSSMSMNEDDDNSSAQPKFEISEPGGILDNLECRDCGRRFERELELRIHSHIHRHIETPSQNNDSQNGFDDQFLIANIKSEPVEYVFDPMDWPDTTQSDADNSSLQADDDLRWKCTICQKRFLRRAHLRAHRRQHALERSDTAPKPTSTNTNANISGIAVTATTSSATTTPTTATVISEKKNKLKEEKKIIPAQQKHEKTNVNLLKKKFNLNVTADAQHERWQCKKCFSTFRTRRLLRDHNVVHRNLHQSFTLLDLDANFLTGTSGTDASIIHFDADSDDAVAAATAAAVAMDVERLKSSPAKKLQTNTPPKSHSTPVVKHSSSGSNTSESRWKCPKCRKVFDTPKALRKHKLANHTFEIKLNLKSKNFISDKKSVSFSDLMSKKKKLEVRSQFTERDWPCNSCGQVFNRRNLLREHRRTVHMLKPTVGVSISMKQEEMEDFVAEEYAVAD
ncbi:zinc finger protein 91-like [Contarinia nasturtii]|uniref:zinc finger protein 91-like n=1 Tax=Contarinia nasturtii TaxID=265458 RepID=UPI0012D490BE|nr:zinc finger protein 91-like [Contarinia nasturtii]